MMIILKIDNDFDDPLIKDFDEKNSSIGKDFKCPNMISKNKSSLAQIAEAMER